ncbi:hypothetical protein EMCRGX_G014549 [Ephydatia muelleri]
MHAGIELRMPFMLSSSETQVFSPDGFDTVSVQNVGSTYIIVSWDLPTDSNGILINFSLYCNGALAGVLPLTHEKDSPPGGPPDPESDTNDIVISLFINKIINPDKSFGSSDPMCILLLQLSSLLVEHTAPNIHDSNKSVQIQVLLFMLALGPDCYHKTHKGSPRCTQPLSWLK